MGFYRNLQKNRPQANALAVATSSALLAGMHIGFGLLNFFLELQQWAWEASLTVINLVIISWYVGAILGLIFGKYLLSRQEKVVINFLSLGLYSISGILTIISPTEALTIGCARGLAGIAHGCIYITAIVHAGEIAVKEMRGYLLASLHVCVYIGMFIYSIITANMGLNAMDPNRLTGIITLVYVVAGGFSYFFAQESPVFLIQRNRDGDAKQTMMRLRSETVETSTLNTDFLEFKAMVAEDEQLSSSIFSDRNWRPLLIMIALRLLTVMTFNLPLNFVRVTFAVSQTGQYVSTLISGLRMVSGLVLLYGFDHLPRRKIFLPSAIPPCMSLLTLTVLYATGVFNPGDIGPLISVCVFDFFAGLSVGQLTGILSAEAFALPKKVNSLVATISFEYALQISLCLSLMKIEDFELWMFLIIQFTCLGIMVVCVGLLLRFMPETSGKSLRDARDLFRGYRMDHHDF